MEKVKAKKNSRFNLALVCEKLLFCLVSLFCFVPSLLGSRERGAESKIGNSYDNRHFLYLLLIFLVMLFYIVLD